MSYVVLIYRSTTVLIERITFLDKKSIKHTHTWPVTAMDCLLVCVQCAPLFLPGPAWLFEIICLSYYIILLLLYIILFLCLKSFPLVI